MAGGEAEEEAAIVLDPYACIPKRSRKYASECTEVYLAKQGGQRLSEDFSHFGNLEVVWLNGNRLSRLENLESNFRIRELYLEDNRLVSLGALKTFKFLKVLLAANNQLRNLDRQLALLTRFGFLEKLELFGNPVAEEPDYRLRVIYHAPQVALLDQHAVRGPERIRADEVVPNLDKVSQSRPQPKKEAKRLSELERSCFKEARDLRERRRREEEALLTRSFAGLPGPDSSAAGLPLPKRFLPAFRLDAAGSARAEDGSRLSQRERREMRAALEKRAGRSELKRDEVEELCRDLAREGLEEGGRVLLGGAEALLRPSGEAGSVPRRLLADPEAAVPVGEVAEWLLGLEWPYPDGQDVDQRAKQAYEGLVRAERAGDAEGAKSCRAATLRLTRGRSYTGALMPGAAPKTGRGPSATGAAKSLNAALASRHAVSLELCGSATLGATAFGRGNRGDFYKQSFLRPCKSVDAATGRTVTAALHEGRHTVLGGSLPALV